MPQGPIATTVVNAAATGNTWFVNPLIGKDSNGGTSSAPFATLAAAQAAALANNGDVVFLIGTCEITATLVWAKNGVSLVGVNSPSDNDRARISNGAAAAAFSPLVSVTAQGCTFANIGTFMGGQNSATPQVCWADSGGRNFYSSCQFLGGGDATAAAQAGMRSLTLAGSGENLFVGCTIGLDTIARATAANASLELLSGTARNTFRSCIFQMLSSLATNVHVLAGASGLDRYCLLDNCSLINAVDSTATTINAAISADAAAGGSILVQGGLSVGATAIATTGPVYVTGAVPAATTSSIAIKAT